jgi:hypothetical protein
MDAIDRINSRYFLLRNVGGQCLVGEMVRNPTRTGLMLSLQGVDAFKTWHANVYTAVREQDGEGNTTVKRKPVAATWLASTRRRQYEGVELTPGAGETLPDGNLNLWRGYGIEPREGKWERLRRHVFEVLAAGDERACEYILRWTAWAFQHPGERAEAALVLQGGKGSGKGIYLRAIGRCFGEHAMQIFNREHLVGKFNGHLRSCLYLFADEAYWAGDRKAESVLKGLISEPTIPIEQKRIDVVQWPNQLKVAMSANADWVVPASADERRYAVFQGADLWVRGTASASSSRTYFRELHEGMEKGELAAMFHSLLHLDLGDWHPRDIYETQGLRKQKEESLGGIEEWWVGVLEEGKVPGVLTNGPRDFGILRNLYEDARAKVPRLRDMSERQLTKFLHKQGCEQVRERRIPAEPRGWRFPPLDKLRYNWGKRYGGYEWREEASEWG